jgi:hypothetical protein
VPVPWGTLRLKSEEFIVSKFDQTGFHNKSASYVKDAKALQSDKN